MTYATTNLQSDSNTKECVDAQRKVVTNLIFPLRSCLSHSQKAFIWDRCIYNGWVIASEVLDSIKKNKDGLIFKLDFEKTYDKVD